MVKLGKYVKGKKPIAQEQKRKIFKMRHKEKTQEELTAEQEVMKLAREKLKNEQQEMQKIAHLNRLKIMTHWRKIMRLAKTEAMKKEIKFFQQNHDREMDAKDAIIVMLDKDLDEAEEQYQMALRNHLIHVDQLLEIQEARLQGLEQEFNRDLSILKEEFDIEKEEIFESHDLEQRELQFMNETVMEAEEEKDKNARGIQEGQREETKNANLEDSNNMKASLISKISKLNRDFEANFNRYASHTAAKFTTYEGMLKENDDATAQINRNMKLIERKKNEIFMWKLKIEQNAKECEARNDALKKEKEKIRKHYQELKSKMSQFREDQSKRLVDLTTNSKNCMDTLKDYLKLADKILKTAELCRKLETEKEKVIPFYKNDPDTTVESPEELEEKIEGVQKGRFNEFMLLDQFYKRYNKVLLDKLAIDKQKNTLEKENMFFKNLLKQYLDGVSVNDDVMNNQNPLLVVNHKISLNRPPVDRAELHKTTIEANVEINNLALQRAGVPPHHG